MTRIPTIYGLLIILAFLMVILIQKGIEARELAPRCICQNHMHFFDLALMEQCSATQSNYPTDLSLLSTNSTSSEIFFCPSRPSHLSDRDIAALPRSDLHRFTDYIYIAGLNPQSPPNTPVIICPPEHHKGRGMNVLDADHSTRWCPMPPAAFDKYMADLYAYARSNNLQIVVSDALTSRSKGRYHSQP